MSSRELTGGTTLVRGWKWVVHTWPVRDALVDYRLQNLCYIGGAIVAHGRHMEGIWGGPQVVHGRKAYDK